MGGPVAVQPCCTDVPTPVGPARAWRRGPASPPATLVLGHGAGGGVGAPDLLAARDAALASGLAVVLVEQPWRVAGRRVAEAPSRLDAAWLAVLDTVDGPLLLGGRSAGARVACRTAGAAGVRGGPGVIGVLALAFPLQTPRASRLHELRLPTVPRLVVQGSRDGFGIPDPEPGVQVHVVAGADHGFAVRRKDGRTPAEVQDEIGRTVQTWLGQTLT